MDGDLPRHRYWLFAFMLLGVFAVIYFPEMAAFNLSIDEELAAFRPDATAWVRQGRWTAAIVEQYFVPRPTVPYFPVAFFGAALVATFMLIRTSALWRNAGPLSWRDFLAFAVFCGFPTWFFMVEFYSNIIAVGFGALCCGVFTHLLGKALTGSRAIVFAGCAGAVGAIAIGVYQSFALALVVLATLSLLQIARSESPRPRHWGLSLIALAIAAALYAVAEKLSYPIAGVLPSDYTESILDPRTALANPLLSITNLGRAAFSTFGFDQAIYVYPAWGFAGLAITGIVALAFWPRRAFPLSATFLVAVVAAPFALQFFAGDKIVPTRSMVAVPFAAWALAHMALHVPRQWVQKIGAVTITIALVQAIYMFSSYQAAIRVAANYDRGLAAEIHARIIDQYPASGRPLYLDVFGSGWVFNPYPTPPTSTAGRSFFDWGNGETRRVAPYMQLAGYTDLLPLPEEHMAEFLDVLLAMPNWPAPGSVRVVGNVALLRLGDVPDTLHQRLIEMRGSNTLAD